MKLKQALNHQAYGQQLKIQLENEYDVHLYNDVDSELYAEILLKIGDDCLEVNDDSFIYFTFQIKWVLI